MSSGKEIIRLNGGERPEEGVDLVVLDKKKLTPPRKFKVLLHNDDYTTMEFVIYVLKKIFHKSGPEAEQIMLKIHHEGVGICGVYSFEVAETKVVKVTSLAKENGHPLKCSMEVI